MLAQTGSIRGQVTDETGAIVPGAVVTLTGPNGPARTAQVDERGGYALAGIAPGKYSIAAAAPQLGMAPLSVEIQDGVQTLNLQLKVAVTTQQVTVQDNAGPSVSTETSNNASALVLRGTDLDALSDDPDDLAADLQALAGPSAGPSGGSMFIDGFSGGELPPKNSIREIRINQNPFAAEFDKLGYGRIEIFTKPGSEKYHAQVDYNFGDAFWNTRNPYASAKAPFLLQELEGNAGGPITKRSSFTIDFQRNAVDNGYITNGFNLAPGTNVIQPFSSVYSVPQRFYRLSPRADYQLSTNSTLMFRYSVTHATIDGAGIGNLNLPELGYYFQYTNQTVQLTETTVFGSTVNETRFQYYRTAPQRTAKADAPEIQVLQSFNGGGSPQGHGYDYQNSYEFQNNTMMVHGSHAIKFGARLRGQTDDNISPLNFNGTFTFGGGLAPVLDANNQPTGATESISSIERYRRTVLGLPGGGPSQFSINAGTPEISVGQVDVGLYATDDWRVRPNITVSLGLRYEAQSNIHDWRDIAPRVAVAWAPRGGGKNARPKTVLRGGFGIFYDRFALNNTLAADRYNGIVQQQYVIANPTFYPNIPPLASLAGYKSLQAIQEISSSLRAPAMLQSAITLERQLPANTTLAVTYTNSRGTHDFRSNDINAPLPATGLLPYPGFGPIFLMESSGIYKQNQVVTNVNSRINSNFSIFAFYVLNKAMSNTDGFGTFPANPYNFAGEYGPASTDIRHRVTIGGSITLRYAIRLSPYFVIQSGQPFDITTGSDPYGTSLFNARPGLAIDPNKTGVIQTPYGLLDPNPTAGETILSRNYGRGPGQVAMNLRVSKTVGFGPEKGGGAKSAPGPSTGGGMANAQAATGRGLGSLLAGATTDRRYNLILSMSIRNLLNHNNPGPINGDITSPLFGLANQIAGGLNGEGFSENANNRRLEMQIRFTF
jgi:hypothetical protein